MKGTQCGCSSTTSGGCTIVPHSAYKAYQILTPGQNTRNRRRQALRDSLFDGIEFIGDRTDYTGFPSALTSEELRKDHRRLPAEKQAMIHVEVYESEKSPTLSRRLDGSEVHDHATTGRHLRFWVEMNDDTSPPTEEICNSE